MLKKVKIQGYRSIRNLTVLLDRINNISGPNGSGKSNLYKSIYLISKAATGELAKSVAQEGGMSSTLWAGSRQKKKPVRLSIEITIDEFVYGLELGLPHATETAFLLDPMVKKEYIKFRTGNSTISLLERGNQSVLVRDHDGRMVHYFGDLVPSESILSQVSDPQTYPELFMFSNILRKWRFYHHFRTDAVSPIRSSQIGYFSPRLDHDGINLAAVIQTLYEMGMGEQVNHFFSLAFPGNRLWHMTRGSLKCIWKFPGSGGPSAPGKCLMAPCAISACLRCC